MRAAGKYHFLPLERLGELDAKMARPLRPGLVRPQQRSFPPIDGLYLLLRATRLGVPKGMGKKTGMLVLDPAMLDQWRTMNATEHYFNLLEAWLRHYRFSSSPYRRIFLSSVERSIPRMVAVRLLFQLVWFKVARMYLRSMSAREAGRNSSDDASASAVSPAVASLVSSRSPSSICCPRQRTTARPTTFSVPGHFRATDR